MSADITRKRYKLRLVYKSGYVHNIWVYDYRLEGENSYLTPVYSDCNDAILLNPENLESAWQVDFLKAGEDPDAGFNAAVNELLGDIKNAKGKVP